MEENIQFIKGIGEARAKSLSKLGVNTVSDLLYFFPRTYEDRSKFTNINECVSGETVCISAAVFSAVRQIRTKGKMVISTMMVKDETGTLCITWYNNKFAKNIFRIGDTYVFYGKVSYDHGKLSLVNPLHEKAGERKIMGRIAPIYPLSAGLVQKNISGAIENAISYCGEIEDILPLEIRKRFSLAEINYSIKNIHFPESFSDKEKARDRLVFEELLVLQLALFMKKSDTIKNRGAVFSNFGGVNKFVNSLNYSLTNAQIRVCKEIFNDFKSGIQMNRLIQGDVGSGKTIVSAIAMLVCVNNGYQSIMMAPTEILATQHFNTLKELFSPLGINVVLLTGSATAKEKRFLYDDIETGLADIIVGTHAVISEKVKYSKLGLVIADEQHRFGVEQRAKLLQKGDSPHMLIMSATPIPRTLALILYGDLSVSVIDELPPGRKKVLTYSIPENIRKRAYAFLKKGVDAGNQAYVVCPLVEETEKLDLENSVALSNKLSEIFPNFRIGLIHGKMKPKAKDEVMRDFVLGKINILVSTTVIEVGVNVPNSNLMIIENAERFGLSQLHQLRGRIGRGGAEAFCIMVAHSNNEVTQKRMKIMCTSNDGFYISEQDLLLRGPGDFFGTRQHGLPDMKIANLFCDREMLSKAQTAAKYIADNNLLNTDENYLPLRKRVDELIDKAIAMN